MSPAKKPPGKGLQEKRLRLLRSLEAHVRYLTTTAALEPWQPAAFGHEPRPRQTPDEWAAYWERYAPPRYVSPRERPELKYPAPGPEALSEDEVKAWVAVSPFVRGGLSYRTQQSLAYIDTFKREPPRG